MAIEYFETSHPVTGEYFVGRKDDLKFFQESFDDVVEGRRSNILFSLTGMNRIGKTSLILQICENFKKKQNPNVYLLYTSLGRFNCFGDFWRDVVLALFGTKNKAISYGTTIGQDIGELESIRKFFHSEVDLKKIYENDVVQNQEVEERLQEFLCVLHDEKKKLILIIDEFDLASEKIFKSYDLNWFRGLLDTLSINLSVITISRRTLQYIENCRGGSTFSGKFTSYPLYGFSNSEINLFLREVEKRIDKKLKKEQKKDIWHCCGRSPYYLAIKGNELLRAKAQNSVNTIDLKTIPVNFYDSFDRIIELLREENLYRSMLKMFIGPTFDLQQSEVDKLEHLGYCMVNDHLLKEQRKDYLDLFDPDKTNNYMSVSHSFEAYLYQKSIIELENIWPALTKTETLLRRVIEEEYKRRNPFNWIKEIKDFVNWKQNQDTNGKTPLDYCYDQFEALYNNAGKPQQDATGNSYLNVASIRLLRDIITGQDWNTFKKYFAGIEQKDLYGYLDELYEARNPYAHSNGKLLAPDTIEKVNQICVLLCNKIESILYPQTITTSTKPLLKLNDKSKQEPLENLYGALRYCAEKGVEIACIIRKSNDFNEANKKEIRIVQLSESEVDQMIKRFQEYENITDNHISVCYVSCSDSETSSNEN